MIGEPKPERIFPSEDSVVAMTTFKAAAYMRMGLSDHDAQEKAFDELGDLARNLGQSVAGYVGIHVLNKLIAFSHVAEWTAADQIPYADNISEFVGLNALSLSSLTNHLLSHPTGIHMIMADDQLTPAEKKLVFGVLLNDATQKARNVGSSQIRTQSYPADPVLEHLIEHGFEPGTEGIPIVGINFKQTQYIKDVSGKRNGHLAPVIPFSTSPNPRAA